MKLDLHTHTYKSGDSTTTYDEYIKGFAASGLDIVAVTDHLTIDGARYLAGELGHQVIIGQEFKVREGELIGLYLQERIPPGLTAISAARLIHAQGGLVYVPHPSDDSRASISFDDLENLCSIGTVDIIEVANSKYPPAGWIGPAALMCEKYGLVAGAGSDAHVESAIGSTFVDTDALAVTSPSQLLDALAQATVDARYFDPPRAWTSRIVPSR